MKNRASQIFLAISIFFAIAVLIYVFKPSGNRKYHLIISGISKGRIQPFRARFRPYKGKKMGGAAGLKAVVNETVASFSGEPYNFFSLGSEISGTADAYFTRGEAIIKTLNACHIDGMLVGNIEFTFGQDRLRELSKIAEFPFISSNVFEGGTGQAPEYISSEMFFHPGAGLKIGVVGLTPPTTPDVTSKGNVYGLEFLFPDELLKNRIQNLKKSGADLVILLTLYDRERISPGEWAAIADAQPDVCIMIDYQIEAPSATMKDGVVVKTISGYNKSKEIDVLDFEVSQPPTKILSFAGRRIPINHAEIDPDPQMEKIVEETTKSVWAVKKQTIGEFSADYARRYSKECPIGNLIADAMLDAYKGDLAIQNSGGIQNNIQEGKFTLGNLFSVLPFDNQVVQMTLTGQDLLELFTRSASVRRGILQVSNCSYRFSNRGYNDYELKEVLIAGKPIVATQTYKVTANSFLSDGGDNFLAFKRGGNLKFGDQQRDVVQAYIKKLSENGPIKLSIQNRVIRDE